MSLSTAQLTKALKVKERIQETKDAVSLVLEIPDDLKEKFRYQAGQFVTFFLDINGEQLNRSYSLCSTPEIDAEFKVTIKKVPGGKGSTYLCDKVKVGDKLNTTPPAGHFFKPQTKPGGIHFFLFAAGSGVTPIFSVMKKVLHDSPDNQVTMLYANRDEDSIIFKKQLEEWQTKFVGRLHITHLLRDFVTIETVGMILRQSSSKPFREYYSCGPTPFMELIKSSLLASGINKENIHEESFGTPATAKPPAERNPDWTYIGPDDPEGKPEKMIAVLDGETLEIDVKEGFTVLELLLDSGANPPYSCMAGACMACLAKVQAGQVYQPDPGILTDENIEKCEALTCQAKPLSRVVKVSYDNL